MSLTHCPDCDQLSFLNASSCVGCGETFPPDALRKKAAAEERAFRIKYGTLYLAVLLSVMAALFFFLFRDYLSGTGAFRA